MHNPKHHHDTWHHHGDDPSGETAAYGPVLQYSDPPVENSPSLSAHHLLSVIGGEAIAIGHDTSTIGFVDSVTENLGNCTAAFGVAIFGATSHSFGEDAAPALAKTFAHVTGADWSIEIHFDERGVEGASAWALSETEYIAIDVPGASSKSLAAMEALAFAAQLKTDLAPSALGFTPGNVADIFATADAHGTATLAATLTHAFTVENHFSYVSGFSVIAA